MRGRRGLQPLQRRSQGDRSRAVPGGEARSLPGLPGASLAQETPGVPSVHLKGSAHRIFSMVGTPLSIVYNNRKPNAERSAFKANKCVSVGCPHLHDHLHRSTPHAKRHQQLSESCIQVQLHVAFSEAPGC